MPNENAPALAKVIPPAFRELLLLDDAEKRARSRSDEEQSLLRELATAVDTRASAADSLSAWDQLPPALTLLRDATMLAIRATIVSRGHDGAALPDAATAFQKLDDIVAAEGLTPPTGYASARALLSDTRHLAFDDLPQKEAFQKRADAEETLRWIRGLFDARTLSQVKFSRALRIGSVAVILVGAIVWVVAWGAIKLFSPPNIALGKPVQISSRRPDFPPGSGPQGLPPSGLTDGSKHGAYDVCTNDEVNPFATVDLLKPYPIKKVKVYNRGDCCWGALDLPVILELSEDGTNFTLIARRTTAYTDSDPWEIPVDGRSARFVRIRSDATIQRELVLNEIEVFSR